MSKNGQTDFWNSIKFIQMAAVFAPSKWNLLRWCLGVQECPFGPELQPPFRRCSVFFSPAPLLQSWHRCVTPRLMEKFGTWLGCGILLINCLWQDFATVNKLMKKFAPHFESSFSNRMRLFDSLFLKSWKVPKFQTTRPPNHLQDATPRIKSESLKRNMSTERIRSDRILQVSERISDLAGWGGWNDNFFCLKKQNRAFLSRL